MEDMLVGASLLIFQGLAVTVSIPTFSMSRVGKVRRLLCVSFGPIRNKSGSAVHTSSILDTDILGHPRGT